MEDVEQMIVHNHTLLMHDILEEIKNPGRRASQFAGASTVELTFQFHRLLENYHKSNILETVDKVDDDDFFLSFSKDHRIAIMAYNMLYNIYGMKQIKNLTPSTNITDALGGYDHKKRKSVCLTNVSICELLPILMFVKHYFLRDFSSLVIIIVTNKDAAYKYSKHFSENDVVFLPSDETVSNFDRRMKNLNIRPEDIILHPAWYQSKFKPILDKYNIVYIDRSGLGMLSDERILSSPDLNCVKRNVTTIVYNACQITTLNLQWSLLKHSSIFKFYPLLTENELGQLKQSYNDRCNGASEWNTIYNEKIKDPTCMVCYETDIDTFLIHRKCLNTICAFCLTQIVDKHKLPMQVACPMCTQPCLDDLIQLTGLYYKYKIKTIDIESEKYQVMEPTFDMDILIDNHILKEQPNTSTLNRCLIILNKNSRYSFRNSQSRKYIKPSISQIMKELEFKPKFEYVFIEEAAFSNYKHLIKMCFALMEYSIRIKVVVVFRDNITMESINEHVVQFGDQIKCIKTPTVCKKLSI